MIRCPYDSRMPLGTMRHFLLLWEGISAMAVGLVANGAAVLVRPTLLSGTWMAI